MLLTTSYLKQSFYLSNKFNRLTQDFINLKCDFFGEQVLPVNVAVR